MGRKCWCDCRPGCPTSQRGSYWRIARDAREQSHRAPSDAAHRRGSALGVGCGGGAAQAGSAPGASGSGETSDEWRWSDGTPDRRQWVEVKTLAIGEVTHNRRGEVCTQQLSYCSRLGDAASFEQATLLATHRRGLERAVAVCAVQDGAEWLQRLVDYHRADAQRILDFAHAAEYISALGQAVQLAGGRLPAGWLEGMLHRLKHQGPARVLKHLAWLAACYPSPTLQEKLAYLQKRKAHMQYQLYQEAGWPIGSGSVESANKLVVEARLKGAGMRWVGRTSTPCWCCAMRCAIASGSRPGRPRWRSDKRCAPSVGKQRANSGWSMPCGSCHLGRTAVSAVSSLWCCCSHHDTGHREATHSSSWFWLLLAQPLSRSPSTTGVTAELCAKK